MQETKPHIRTTTASNSQNSTGAAKKSFSLRAKLTLIILIVSFSVLIISGLATIYSDYKSVKVEINDQLSSLAKLMGDRSSAALVFFDEKTAAENLSSLKTISNIDHACLYDGNGRLFASYLSSSSIIINCPPNIDVNQSDYFSYQNLIEVSYEIMDGDNLTGKLFVFSTRQPIHDRIKIKLTSLAINLLIGLILAILLASWLQRLISEPIEKITKTTKQIIEHQDYSVRAPIFSDDEVGRLADNFNLMLKKIAEQQNELQLEIKQRELADQALREINQELEHRVDTRTSELALKNNELSKAMQVLEAAKEELVESEKLASLGSVVAGVAHELNTPIGIGVTAASNVEHHLDEFVKKIQENQISREDLDHFVDSSKDGIRLVLANLNRAGELVRGFKQVAVDQTSAKRRQFELSQMIIEVVSTLKPKFKHTPHEVCISIPEEINMDSYPGPFGQVITNLVINSLVHGFNNEMKGRVEISASKLNNKQVRINVIDNGSGIDREHIKHVFDPFFTTRLGQGGSGLGMHISYSIITAVMGGKISISSQKNKETKVKITVPLVAPFKS